MTRGVHEMARHLPGRSALSAMVLGGALLAGAIGSAGAANAAPAQGMAPAPAGVMSVVPLPQFPPPPVRAAVAAADPTSAEVGSAAATAARTLGTASAEALALMAW
ncbi:hypothetical protein [Mycolicibacterium fortuitum]|uniref:hypothetical protein n=1 Tax=Mycolicibacterium fortuitum TaxID=1766 RepID=UPI001CDD5386|nr:hypothetical protein [Mycolicibacterium fortuitum]